MKVVNLSDFDSFIERINEGIKRNLLNRVLFSKPSFKDDDGLERVICRVVEIRGSLVWSCVFRYETRDETKNFSFSDWKNICKELLGVDGFRLAILNRIDADWNLHFNKRGKTRLIKSKATFGLVQEKSHDSKEYKKVLDSPSYFVDLGVLTPKGFPVKGMGHKYKQILNFVQLLSKPLAEILREQTELKMVDMGSGKGYLTFALYDYVVNKMNLRADMKGVELRSDLVNLCNKVAKKHDFVGLSFEKGMIQDVDTEKMNVLVALHACNTATDEAIYKGLIGGSDLIVVAPCCHKQVRKQMTKSKIHGSLVRHGIMKDRLAEMVTDSIRALILEWHGYKTSVIEWIGTEHTQKNVMIIAKRIPNFKVDKRTIKAELLKLKEEYGLGTMRLEELTKIAI